MRLSHSACAKYQICPKSYEFHYVDKIRPNTTTGALIFGSALDAALNELLKPMTTDKVEDIFIREFSTNYINGELCDIRTSNLMVYSNSDYDEDLVPEEYYSKLDEMSKLRQKKTQLGLPSLTQDERTLYNIMNWECLKVKGLLMLAAYKRKILPKITKVHDVQIEIELSNGEDKITGHVDLVADLEGFGTVIIDHKTSSIQYEEDAVLTSPQLTLYMHALYEKYDTRKAGYIVLSKRIQKNRVKVCSKCGFDGSGSRHKTCANEIEGVRCGGEWMETIRPDITFQIIIDEIPPITEDIVLENYDIVNNAIKTGVFPRNLHSCNNFYGGKCPYFQMCYKNSTVGLIKVDR